MLAAVALAIDNLRMNNSIAPAPDAYELRWQQRCELRNLALVTYRYHSQRQRFFDLLDKLTKATTVLLGATLFGEALKLHLPLVGSLIAGLSLLALIFSYSDKKQVHKELAESAMLLAGDIDALPATSVSDASLTDWQTNISRINAKEPPALSTLVTLCEQAQATADGHPSHVPSPHPVRRFFADFKS